MIASIKIAKHERFALEFIVEATFRVAGSVEKIGQKKENGAANSGAI
jgi:hypothetical protein